MPRPGSGLGLALTRHLFPILKRSPPGRQFMTCPHCKSDLLFSNWICLSSSGGSCLQGGEDAVGAWLTMTWWWEWGFGGFCPLLCPALLSSYWPQPQGTALGVNELVLSRSQKGRLGWRGLPMCRQDKGYL